ncbi:hypothetical protein QO034_18470 [Sedimentitalea sp. JM2-8]|uniref:Core-binding (CB) domain-containing protein n=1 Tax=Sedimentitalea xiamensis TaxID=3050037 RepID=A0ABT7FIW4_9RHOB|nr:hypothetical protein [Sedimentitalea xiamensis]MDK3075077.1 hypothetical protein [Sedimentitalea xiamensis]
MVVVVSLKHIDELSGGRKRFRRRWPKDVGKALGEAFMQRPMVAREGAALVAERETLLREFDATVAKHRRSQEERDRLTPRQLWGEMQEEAERLTSGVVGDVEGALDALAEEAQRNEDPLLYRAIKTPEIAKKPAPTLADAFDLYARLKIDDSQGRNPRNRLDRLRRRTETALGRLNELPLDDLRREHGRAVLDVMKEASTSTGKPLSSETIKRELNMLAAITELGLIEFDLAGVRANPFRRLETKRPGEAPVSATDARLPLPPEVIAEVRHRLATKTKTPDLSLICEPACKFDPCIGVIGVQK